MPTAAMGYYNPNMVQVPLETFSFSAQSDVSPLQQEVRCSKWSPDQITGPGFTRYLDPKCRTMYEAFRQVDLFNSIYLQFMKIDNNTRVPVSLMVDRVSAGDSLPSLLTSG